MPMNNKNFQKVDWLLKTFGNAHNTEVWLINLGFSWFIESAFVGKLVYACVFGHEGLNNSSHKRHM